MLIASILTVAWLVVLGAIVFSNWNAMAEMAPNEWGDFLAGSFAPLAFMWLVFGYFLQGRELKLNREALMLQAEELKNSVLQQKELVNVTREDIELTKSEYSERINQEAKRARPSFKVTDADYVDNVLTLNIINYGAAVRGVIIYTYSPDASADICNFEGEYSCDSIETYGRIKVDFSIKNNTREVIEGFVLVFEFMDGRGESMKDYYSLRISETELLMIPRTQFEVDEFLNEKTNSSKN